MKLLLGILPGTASNGETFSDIMAYNHYGTETIPPRPVLRIGAERILHSPKMQEHIAAFFRNVAEYTKAGRPQDIKKAERTLLTAIGQQCAAEAKRVIDDGGILQHNSPATVAQKGFDKALYVDGNLKNHISYEIEEGK